jgi:putative ABC transport system substrate-binding protein
MRRRTFIASVGAALVVGPVKASAQQLPLIGYLNSLSASDRPSLLAAFRQGLAVTGYVEGRDVRIDYRYSNNQPSRLHDLAADLISRQVNVIVATGGNSPALVAKSLTSTIPIAFTSGIDPVKGGLVKSLSHPEGNLTGVNFFSTELGQKHLELIHELLPHATRLAVLLNRNNPEAAAYEQPIEKIAKALGMSLTVLDGSSADKIDDAFAKFEGVGATGLLVGADPYLSSRAKQIVALAARFGLPAIYANREFIEIGGLISYGNSISDAYRRAGIYTGRILKGDKPANLPVDRATKFELLINMKTAKALGIDVPLSLQMRIDEVVE